METINSDQDLRRRVGKEDLSLRVSGVNEKRKLDEADTERSHLLMIMEAHE